MIVGILFVKILSHIVRLNRWEQVQGIGQVIQGMNVMGDDMIKAF